MQTLLALLIGLTIGLGIFISGMGNPAKVLNFFDVAGHWDPSLALVIAGAVSVTAIGYRFVLRWPRPHLAQRFNVPTVRTIDASLVMGSAIFGIGWVLSGFCPGGLIPVVGIARTEPLPFLGGLLTGLIATRFLRARIESPKRKPARARPQWKT